MVLLVDEIRLTRDAERYGFAVGKVRVLESRKFDRAMFERLLDARDFAEQKRLLSETPYGRYIENAETPSDVEAALAAALEDFYGFLGKAALPEPVTRFFRVRYDFANLKAAVKAQLLDASVDDLLVEHGSVPVEAFRGDLSELPEPLAEAVPEALRVSEESEDATSDVRAIEIDTAVDQAMFAELLLTARRSRSAYLLRLARLAIDLANVKTIIRAKLAGHAPKIIEELLIDGGSVPVGVLRPLTALEPEQISQALEKVPALHKLSGEPLHDTSRLDVALDAVTQAALREGRMGQVGPEPVISYVLAREAEVATVRMLLLGKMARLKDETLRRHLRAMD